MNISKALQQGVLTLQQKSDSPRLDAELLMSFCLKKPRTFLFSHADEELTPKELIHWEFLLKLRQSSLPIAYLTGQKEFWSIPLNISINTLIPRPATESLVEYILDFYAKHSQLKVCDLGTGSGAIAIALAKERTLWKIHAIDVHENTLAMAKYNALKNNCQQIKFICSDWFNKLPNEQFDLIVSNPPYIAPQDPHLTQGDVQHEPKRALISYHEGYKDLEYLVIESQQHLKQHGQIILEHGYQQSHQIVKLMENHGLKNIQSFPDHDGNPRFCVGFKE
jgi:release factor glutamine methyltransferase